MFSATTDQWTLRDLATSFINPDSSPSTSINGRLRNLAINSINLLASTSTTTLLCSLTLPSLYTLLQHPSPPPRSPCCLASYIRSTNSLLTTSMLLCYLFFFYTQISFFLFLYLVSIVKKYPVYAHSSLTFTLTSSLHKLEYTCVCRSYSKPTQHIQLPSGVVRHLAGPTCTKVLCRMVVVAVDRS